MARTFPLTQLEECLKELARSRRKSGVASQQSRSRKYGKVIRKLIDKW